MEIRKATKEEFYAQRGDKNRRPETEAVLKLAADEVMRIVNHDHVLYNSGGMCGLGVTLKRTCNRNGMKVSVRHDGDDMLVMRVK